MPSTSLQSVDGSSTGKSRINGPKAGVVLIPGHSLITLDHFDMIRRWTNKRSPSLHTIHYNGGVRGVVRKSAPGRRLW